MNADELAQSRDHHVDLAENYLASGARYSTTFGSDEGAAQAAMAHALLAQVRQHQIDSEPVDRVIGTSGDSRDYSPGLYRGAGIRWSNPDEIT